jgi:LacI family transcriptional regulator
MSESIHIGLVFSPESHFQRRVFSIVARASHHLKSVSVKWISPSPAGLGNYGGQVSGLIGYFHEPELLEAARKLAVPLVNVSTGAESDGLHSVLTDNEELGRMAAAHLLGLKCASLATVGMAGRRLARQRGSCFQKHVRKQDSNIPLISYEARPGDTFYATSFLGQDAKAVGDFLHSLQHPSGVFCFTDRQAALVMEIARSEGIAVPDELAVLGVDDDPLLTQLTWPPLSSIRPGYERIAKESLGMAMGLIEGDKPKEHTLLVPPVEVVARPSTDLLAIEDQIVLQALQFIREHFPDGITARHVVQAVPLSRRPLENRFKSELGQTILKQIHLTQVAHARRLLVESDLPVERIAHLCGFSGGVHFAKVFRKCTGRTASEFRGRAS